MDAIQWLAVLFIGLFVVATISSLFTEDTFKNYVYSTTTNSTLSNFNSTVNASHIVTLAAFSTIDGKTADKTLTAVVENRNATNSFTITTYLNNVVLETFSALNNTNTTHTFTSVAFVSGVKNNLTYATTATGGNPHNIRSTAAYYPTSTIDSSMGSIYTNLYTKTGTVYKILVLVLIVILLAVAMRSLGGLSGTGASGTSQ